MQALIKTHAALLITGLVSFVLMGAGQSLYGPALPAFARDLGLNDVALRVRLTRLRQRLLAAGVLEEVV